MLYNFKEYGVSKGSELFLATQSKLAESMLFYLHRCGRFVCTKGYKIIRDNFNSYLIFYIERGKMKIENEGKTYIATEGDVGMINCHFPHAYIALEENTTFVWAHFDGSNTQKFYEQIIQRNHAVFHLPKENVVTQNLDAILNLYRSNESISGIHIEPQISVYLYTILCGLLTVKGEELEADIRNQAVEKAILFMKENYHEPLEVKEVAEEIGLSPFHFSRLFKQEINCSPHEFVVLLRLNEAKSLLKTTDLSIAEIAMKIGYEYPSSFVSAFVKKVGISPKKFRDAPI